MENTSPTLGGAVVVGVDGSDHSQWALEYGTAFAAGLGAETIAVRVEAAGAAPGGGSAESAVEARGRKVPLRLVEGRPAPGLLAAADEENARFVVVGRRGADGLPEFILGSTSQRLARLSPRPVVVVPAGFPPDLPGPSAPIAVGVDGSSGSRAALRWAAAVAVAYQCEVVAVHALDLAPALMFSGEPGDVYQQAREAATATVARWCGPLREAGVAHRVVVREGGAALGLLRATGDTDAVLLVVGSRGAGGFPGLTLGSVADQVAHFANVPVAIVPPDEPADGEA